MNIHPLAKTKIDHCLFETDGNGREINIYKLNNIKLVGDSLFYPNPLLYSPKKKLVIKPIEEKIMSLSRLVKTESLTNVSSDYDSVFDEPVFFFIYNVDNYYHFLYDSLPYLISYFHLRKKYPKLKLLINKANPEQERFYKFVLDMFVILKISEESLIIAKRNVLYKEVFISSSYTHGHDSNLPPRSEVYDFFEEIKLSACKDLSGQETPQKIYISRRTWIHNNLSNIGTNYTTRRKMVCEDELVNRLENQGYKEIFTENLSMVEKIRLFSNAKEIIGPIGGGLVNALFNSENTKLLVISSPTFFDVNSRFKFCFKSKNTRYYNKTRHVESEYFKKFMRVQTIDSKVGEITDISGNSITIKYSNESVAGWNSECDFNHATYLKDEITLLDAGLNCNWTFDVKKMMEIVR
jgi:capsular polysaccharide biosynthesis protein